MLARELIKKLKRIEIHTARLANEQLAGGYHSVFKGRGMAFAEVRQYAPGDDVRFIDWNVSARMGDTYVKVFTEEREMTVMLLVDLSASGHFGSVAGTKLETVIEVAALLAFSAIRNGDRVGLILFTDRVERFMPPKKGKAHVMRVLTEILNAKPEGKGTDLNPALELLGKVAKRRSLAFVVSDFMAQGWEHRLRVACRKHDIIPVEVSDPREEDLPDLGLMLAEDLETGELVEVDTSDRAVRERFHQRFAKARVEREQLFQRLRMDQVAVRTTEDCVRPLSNLFRTRMRRMGGVR
jgi:uncharacterized protein (DUF58 family)